MLNYNWVKTITKIKFIFNDDSYYETTGGDNLLSCNISSSISNSSSNALGCVSANKITIDLTDKEKVFAKNNTTSPYYNKLKQGFKIIAYYKVDDGNYEEAGTFKMISILNTTAPSYKASFVGIDSIGFILKRSSTLNYISRDITADSYIRSLLISAGIKSDSINTSSSLSNINIQYTYNFNAQVGELLTSFCNAFMCCIYTDNTGAVNVKTLHDLCNNTIASLEIKYNTNLISSSIDDGILNGYNAIKIVYNKPTEQFSSKILSLTNNKIQQGSNLYEDYSIKSSYIKSIDYISVFNKSNSRIYVKDVDSKQQSISFNVYSENTTEINCDIDVYANVVNTNNVEISDVVDSEFITENDTDKIKYYTVSSDMIQYDAYANNIMSLLKKMNNTDIVYISIKTKGHPNLVVGNIVNFESTELKFSGLCLVTSINISTGSSYTCSITLLNVNAIL